MEVWGDRPSLQTDVTGDAAGLVVSVEPNGESAIASRVSHAAGRNAASPISKSLQSMAFWRSRPNLSGLSMAGGEQFTPKHSIVAMTKYISSFVQRSIAHKKNEIWVGGVLYGNLMRDVPAEDNNTAA